MLGGRMSAKSVRSTTPSQSKQRQAAAYCINRALEKSDIGEVCHAIRAATRLYNISDLAQKSGLARTNIHRAFAGGKRKPNFTTVLDVLDAMGFQLHVTLRGHAPARAARFKPVASCPEAGTKELNGLSLERYHIAPSLWLAIRCPCFHELAPLFERVATTVRLFGFVADDVS